MDKGNGRTQKDDNREERERLEGEIETWKQRVMVRERRCEETGEDGVRGERRHGRKRGEEKGQG